MRRHNARSAVACSSCHRQKLKCTGDVPCQRCKARDGQCTYPSKDRVVVVPESYLYSLEREVMVLRNAAAGARAGAGTATVQAQQPYSAGSNPDWLSDKDTHTTDGQMLDDCSPENFVQKLREMSLAGTAAVHAPSLPPGSSVPFSPLSITRNYTYSRLKIDLFEPEVTLRLPPQPYALHLLDVFEEGFCDYHWMRRKQFRQRLLLTYADPGSQASDRMWLCCVSVVMALAEAWNCGRSPEDVADHGLGLGLGFGFGRQPNMSAPASPETNLPPGAELFEQGLFLSRSPLEEARIEHVEALNLIVTSRLYLLAFYCYSLNRRRTAYLMAGQSVRMATLLRLHEPWPGTAGTSRHERTAAAIANATGDAPPLTEAEMVESEHRKRVWWTSYCMDRMVSTEFGFPPVQDSLARDIALPSDDEATLGDGRAGRDEFFRSHVLTAQIQLCQIKTVIVERATKTAWRLDASASLEVFEHCMARLHEWHRNLPPDMIYTFDAGVPDEVWTIPSGRVLLSMYLRYYQCMILLLRPLFLQELSSLLSMQNAATTDTADMRPSFPASKAVVSLKVECLHAALCNCRILDGMWTHGKIAKFGYWDSLHLFSGLAILCLARIIDLPMPSTMASAAVAGPSSSTDLAELPGLSPDNRQDFDFNTDHSVQGPHQVQLGREQLYSHARALLDEMARVGNPAAKDHSAMLRDVEDIVNRVRSRRGAGPAAAQTSVRDRATTTGHVASTSANDGDNDLPYMDTRVPFFDLADFSFGGVGEEEQTGQSMDWDGIFADFPFE